MKDSDVVRLVLAFLRDREYYDALVALEKDSGISADDVLGEELDFLRGLILKGEWKDVESTLLLFEKEPGFDLDRALFLMRKQRFLELLGRQPPPSTKMMSWALRSCTDLVCCTEEDVNQLKFCLAHMDAKVCHPSWTTDRGRYQCFRNLLLQTGLGKLFFTDPSKVFLASNGTPTLTRLLSSIDFQPIQVEECNRCRNRRTANIFDGMQEVDPKKPSTAPGTRRPPISFDVPNQSVDERQTKRFDLETRTETSLDKRSAETSSEPESKTGNGSMPPPIHAFPPQYTCPYPPQYPMQFPAPDPVIYPFYEAPRQNPPQSDPAASRFDTEVENHVHQSNEDEKAPSDDMFAMQAEGGDESAPPMEDVQHSPKQESAQPTSFEFKSENGDEQIPQEGPMSEEGSHHQGLQQEHENKQPDPQQTEKEIPTEEEEKDEPKVNEEQHIGSPRKGKNLLKKLAKDVLQISKMSSKSPPVVTIEQPTREGPWIKKSKPKKHLQKFAKQQEVDYAWLCDSENRSWITNFHPCAAMVEGTHPLRAVSFSGDGSMLSIGSNAQTISVVKGDWEELGCNKAPALEPVQVVGDENEIFNGKRHLHFAYGGTAKCPQLPLASPSYEHKNSHVGSVYCLDWHQTELIASGSNDKMVKIWKYGEDGLREMYKLTGHNSTVRAVKFDGQSLVLRSVGGGDNGIRTWDVSKGTNVGVWKGHKATVFDLCRSSATNCWYSCSEDDTIQGWDQRVSLATPRNQVLVQQAGGPRSISCFGYSVATGHVSGLICVWDVRAGSKKVLYSVDHHRNEVRCVDFSPDGEWLLACSFDGTVSIIDTSAFAQDVAASFTGHYNKVLQAKWHPRKPLFATCSADGTSKLWSFQGNATKL